MVISGPTNAFLEMACLLVVADNTPRFLYRLLMDI